MTARELKDRLAARHPARMQGSMPGPWTVIEEFRNIDLLAISAWSSAERYARVGYEVKVSRSDYKRELVKPYKRSRNVNWCNQFYFAVPEGLLTDDEIAWVPPEDHGHRSPFERERCHGLYGSACFGGMVTFGRGRLRSYGTTYKNKTSWGDPLRVYSVECPVCRGTGEIAPSWVEWAGAPKLWVPADVGLVTVTERATKIVKPAPRRHEVPAPGPAELGQLLRWVSMRPDLRHHQERLIAQLAESVLS